MMAVKHEQDYMEVRERTHRASQFESSGKFEYMDFSEWVHGSSEWDSLNGDMGFPNEYIDPPNGYVEPPSGYKNPSIR